jgi:hypothetical protein
MQFGGGGALYLQEARSTQPRENWNHVEHDLVTQTR